MLVNKFEYHPEHRALTSSLQTTPPLPPPPSSQTQRKGLHRQSAAMAASGSLLSAAVLLSLTLSALSQSFIRMVPENHFCDSWRFSVETNNAGFWETAPERCLEYVLEYMTGDRYLSDSTTVAADSLRFAEAVNVSADAKDAWVFDVDDTLLSNLPYFETHGFGSGDFNESSYYEWVESADLPALPKSLELYNKLKQMDFAIFLLTGRSESIRNVTETNLLRAGYSNWEELFMRGASDEGVQTSVYKSEKRNEIKSRGYLIHGNSGDQWSDLGGYAVAERSFKLPNPMYYVP